MIGKALSRQSVSAALLGVFSGIAFLFLALFALFFANLIEDGLLAGVAAVLSTLFAVGIANRIGPQGRGRSDLKHLPLGVIVGFAFLFLVALALQAIGMWDTSGTLQGVVIGVTGILMVQYTRFKQSECGAMPVDK